MGNQADWLGQLGNNMLTKITDDFFIDLDDISYIKDELILISILFKNKKTLELRRSSDQAQGLLEVLNGKVKEFKEKRSEKEEDDAIEIAESRANRNKYVNLFRGYDGRI